MKAGKIRELDPKEIDNQLAETNEQLFRLRFQMKMGQTDPVKKYRVLRKDRARLLTVLNEQSRAGTKKKAAK